MAAKKKPIWASSRVIQRRPERASDGDKGVAGDADVGDGDVEFVGGGIFVEGARGEDGIARVVDGAAVELFGDGAGGSGGGVLVVNAEGEDADEDACDGEQGDEILHESSLLGFGVGGLRAGPVPVEGTGLCSGRNCRRQAEGASIRGAVSTSCL